MSARTATLSAIHTLPLPGLPGIPLPSVPFGFGKKAEEDRLPVADPVIREMLGGGFPKGELVELLTMTEASGELSLILPAVASLGRAFWVLPGVEFFTPCAPAMEACGLVLTEQLFVTPAATEEAYWAAERAVAEGTFGAVVAWLKPLSPEEDRRAMRRLALAARTSGTTVFVVRPLNLSGTATNADLRVALSPAADGETRVRVTRAGFLARTETAVVRLSPLSSLSPITEPSAPVGKVRPFRPTHSTHPTDPSTPDNAA